MSQLPVRRRLASASPWKPLLALSLAAALAGCEREPPSSSQPSASAPAAPSSAEPPSPPPPPSAPPFACTPLEPMQLSVPPRITPDSSGKLKARCDRLAADRDKLVAKHPLRGLGDFQARALSATGQCRVGARGAWALSLDSLGDSKDKEAAKRRPAGEQTFEGRFTLVHVKPDGTLERGPSGLIGKDGPITRLARIEAAADVDGDGVDEVLLDEDDATGDEDRKSRRRLLALKGNKIGPFSPAEGLKIERIRDVDGDGLADLVVESPFVARGPCGKDGIVYRGPSLLVRGAKSGKLVTDDAVARAYARVACPHNPNAPLIELETSPATRVDAQATVSRVACALLWGITPSQVQSRLAADYAAAVGPGKRVSPDDASCQPLSLFEQISKTKPPFVLDGCPAEVTP